MEVCILHTHQWSMWTLVYLPSSGHRHSFQSEERTVSILSSWYGIDLILKYSPLCTHSTFFFFFNVKGIIAVHIDIESSNVFFVCLHVAQKKCALSPLYSTTKWNLVYCLDVQLRGFVSVSHCCIRSHSCFFFFYKEPTKWSRPNYSLVFYSIFCKVASPSFFIFFFISQTIVNVTTWILHDLLTKRNVCKFKRKA